MAFDEMGYYVPDDNEDQQPWMPSAPEDVPDNTAPAPTPYLQRALTPQQVADNTAAYAKAIQPYFEPERPAPAPTGPSPALGMVLAGLSDALGIASRSRRGRQRTVEIPGRRRKKYTTVRDEAPQSMAPPLFSGLQTLGMQRGQQRALDEQYRRERGRAQMAMAGPIATFTREQMMQTVPQPRPLSAAAERLKIITEAEIAGEVPRGTKQAYLNHLAGKPTASRDTTALGQLKELADLKTSNPGLYKTIMDVDKERAGFRRGPTKTPMTDAERIDAENAKFIRSQRVRDRSAFLSTIRQRLNDVQAEIRILEGELLDPTSQPDLVDTIRKKKNLATVLERQIGEGGYGMVEMGSPGSEDGTEDVGPPVSGYADEIPSLGEAPVGTEFGVPPDTMLSNGSRVGDYTAEDVAAMTPEERAEFEQEIRTALGYDPTTGMPMSAPMTATGR